MDRSETDRLRKEIVQHKALYYAGHPEISDAAYDELEHQLRLLDPSAPELRQVGSATDGKVKHEPPMQSQEKALNRESLLKFLSKHQPQSLLVATTKMDGMSCSLSYYNGALTRASTRGDGSMGEDITTKCFHIPSIVQRMPTGFCGEVRGELVLGDGFSLVNKILLLENRPSLANKRNGVVGLINEEAVRPDKLHLVEFLAYEVLDDETELDYTEQLRIAKMYRFNTVLSVPVTGSLDVLLDDFKKAIDSSPFDMDGVVFRVNDHKLCTELGRTSHHPRYSIAYKYDAEQRQVVIRRIEWSMGTRDISPIAIFDAVELDGAKISRAGLHSVKNMRDIGARIGAQMTLTRQGQVIPWLQPFGLRLTEDGRPADSLPIDHPSTCPVCGGETKLSDDEAHLTCTQEGCSGRASRQLEVFAKAIGLDFIGKSTALTLASGGIRTPIALLRASESDLIAAGLSPGIARRILESRKKTIESGLSKAQVLAGFGIPRVSNVIAKDLAPHFSLDRNEFPKGLTRLGVAAAEAIRFINLHWEELHELLSLLVKKDTPETATTANKLANQVFVITGALSRPRKEVEDRLEALGAKVSGAVSRSTTYLVTNDSDSTSSKARRAKELGVRVISEEELWTLAR